MSLTNDPSLLNQAAYSFIGLQATRDATGRFPAPESNFMQLGVVPDLGHLIRLQIDPDMPPDVRSLWRSPLGDTLRVTFMDYEQGIPENASVGYADIDILGRSEKFKTYTGTENKEIPLTFQFRAQGRGAGSGTSLARTLDHEVIQPAKWLDALKYPLIGDVDGVANAPPPVLLTIGALIAMRVVLTEANITWQAPFDPETMLPYGADVACSFQAVHTNMGNYDFQGSDRLMPAGVGRTYNVVSFASGLMGDVSTSSGSAFP